MMMRKQPETVGKSPASSSWLTLPLKPLSANQMWYGTKKETSQYRKYKKDFIEYLKSISIATASPLKLKLVVAHSNRQFDLDNVFKPFLDALQKAIDSFNDRDIYEIHAKKIIVGKGEEYIRFKMETMQEKV